MVIKMQTKNRTTITLDSQILETIKQIAINKGTTQTKIINDYLKECIEKEPMKNKSKIKVLLKRDPTQEIDDLIGFIKTDNPFNAVELQNEVRRGE
jgi:hypothetical protein